MSITRLTTKVPFYDLQAVHAPMADDMRLAFERVLANSAFNGPVEVERFEAMFAELVGVPHAVGVGSGTAALHLGLVAAGIGPGDEVILPPNTFFATAEAVVAAGGLPIFADIDPSTGLLDPDAVDAAVTNATAAVIAVHLYGQPVDWDRLRGVADRHRLLLIEDAAQAVGAAWDGRPVGSLGHAGAFSFYPTKNLGALGEAGAITTSDTAVARTARQLRSHGEAAKHVHARAGFNERLDGLQAAFLMAKLPYLPEANAMRLEAVARYGYELANIDGIALVETAARARHAHHLMVVRVDRRDQVLSHIRARGVGAMVHYPTPIHLQPAFAHLGYRPRSIPAAEDWAASVLSLPLFPGITEEQVAHCVRSLSESIWEAR